MGKLSNDKYAQNKQFHSVIFIAVVKTAVENASVI